MIFIFLPCCIMYANMLVKNINTLQMYISWQVISNSQHFPTSSVPSSTINLVAVTMKGTLTLVQMTTFLNIYPPSQCSIPPLPHSMPPVIHPASVACVMSRFGPLLSGKVQGLVVTALLLLKSRMSAALRA